MAFIAPTAKPSRAQADERGLVEAAQRDPASFAALYELHFERVYLFIARRVGNRDVAEDLTGDVFRRALENLRTYEWRGVPFAAWLLRIAANAVRDRAKRGGRELSVEDPPEIGTEPDLAEVEDGARLFRLVNDLPEDQRRVIVMRFAEEESIRAIAHRLERSEGAVKQLQFRALENLRARLESRPRPTPRRSAKLGQPTGRKHG
ncbi:MAG TPA: sigma-70 family RNA polymerase sigma factor [Terriglobales bacterium]|nr:sigma-70 family RNA polymerase sigma factor [Terriglobales bacterium]